MKDRIMQIMQDNGLTNAEFAQKLGVSPASLSHIFSGRNRPSLDVIMHIFRAYPDIRSQWLLFGEEPVKYSEIAAKEASPPAENAIITVEGTDSPDYRKENASAMPNFIPKEIIREEIKYIEKPHPKITEIRVYFDNGTYEVFRAD